MGTRISVFDPSAPERTDGQQARRPLDGLKGKVVGFIDNSKPNFNHLVDDIAALMESRHGVISTVKHSKRGPGVPAPDEVMKNLVEQCDIVITGSGD